MTTYLAYGKICNKRAANEKGGNCGKLQTDTDLGCVFLRIEEASGQTVQNPGG